MRRVWICLALGFVAIAPLRAGAVSAIGEARFEVFGIGDFLTIGIANLQENPIVIGNLFNRISFTLSHFAGPAANAASIWGGVWVISFDRPSHVEFDAFLPRGPTAPPPWTIFDGETKNTEHPGSQTPEPGTILMVVCGAGLLWVARRRRTRGQKV